MLFLLLELLWSRWVSCWWCSKILFTLLVFKNKLFLDSSSYSWAGLWRDKAPIGTGRIVIPVLPFAQLHWPFSCLNYTESSTTCSQRRLFPYLHYMYNHITHPILSQNCWILCQKPRTHLWKNEKTPVLFFIIFLYRWGHWGRTFTFYHHFLLYKKKCVVSYPIQHLVRQSEDLRPFVSLSLQILRIEYIILFCPRH